MKYRYEVEVHTTKKFIVTAQKEGENIRTPIAKCNSEGAALTIKGMYEKYDKENPEG